MELDDFKASWQKDIELNVPRELIQQKIDQIAKSGRRIRMAFIVELAISGAIYFFFIGMIIFFNGEVQSFMYKLVAIVTIGFLPTVYRLYQSQVWINAMDYSTDIRSNLLAFLTYYKTTLKWYWWSSMIISVFMFIMLFTDEDFLSLGMGWQIGTCAYIMLMLSLTWPYLKRVYGKHVRELEAFLE